jgi:hypothetical protein
LFDLLTFLEKMGLKVETVEENVMESAVKQGTG